MLQIIQNLRSGKTILEEVPAPIARKGHVLVRTHCSLVSAGTEKMLVEFSKANLISKARHQPEKVERVLEKIKSDGLLPTLEAVFTKLDEPLPLGYCNAGEIISIGEGVSEFHVGDRVSSNGPHAEYVCVPKNLVANIPDNVSFEEATFAVIGAIGLHGIRLSEPTFGETFVVTGLGLIGLLTAQLLIGNGCNVIGLDVDEHKVNMAAQMGVHAIHVANADAVRAVENITSGNGVDAVIITASSKSNTIIRQAAAMCRKRGRIILIGVVGLDINRDDFYKKELSFRVSCSYGPGRYDDNYEVKGIDYPLPYVRWTEKRNFETILNAISTGKIKVKNLITERVQLKNYMDVYGNFNSKSVASILEYPVQHKKYSSKIQLNSGSYKPSRGTIGIIGAGNYTKMIMLPALKNMGVGFKYIVSAGGVSAAMLAKKYGFVYATTDYKPILNDIETDIVFITTRHNLHAYMAAEALQAGKHVFIEKPLAITNQQADIVEAAYTKALKKNQNISLLVGFNRRFSPFAKKIKQLIGDTNTPLNVVATFNAGYIPPDSWVHDTLVGGGRIIGEACHFIDLMTYFTGSLVESVTMSALGKDPVESTDNAIITLRFANGAQGVINYFSNGNKSYSKERIEIHSLERTLILDNFRRLEGFGFKGFRSMSSQQDKGHKEQFRQLIERVKTGGIPLIPFNSLMNTTRTALAAIDSFKSGEWISINSYKKNLSAITDSPPDQKEPISEKTVVI